MEKSKIIKETERKSGKEKSFFIGDSVSNKKEVKTDEYQAVDEKGVAHTIHVYTTFVEARPISGEAQWLPGSKRHVTQNGQHINVLDNGSLENIVTSKILKRV